MMKFTSPASPTLSLPQGEREQTNRYASKIIEHESD